MASSHSLFKPTQVSGVRPFQLIPGQDFINNPSRSVGLTCPYSWDRVTGSRASHHPTRDLTWEACWRTHGPLQTEPRSFVFQQRIPHLIPPDGPTFMDTDENSACEGEIPGRRSNTQTATAGHVPICSTNTKSTRLLWPTILCAKEATVHHIDWAAEKNMNERVKVRDMNAARI